MIEPIPLSKRFYFEERRSPYSLDRTVTMPEGTRLLPRKLHSRTSFHPCIKQICGFIYNPGGKYENRGEGSDRYDKI